MQSVFAIIIVLIGQACALSFTRALPSHSLRRQPISMMQAGKGIVTPIPVIPRRWTKSTKQLATLGPASNTPEMIEKLFLSGADIFRLNFSHGEHSEKAKVNGNKFSQISDEHITVFRAQLVEIIRSIEAKYNHPIAILGDLQGPKLRVGMFKDGKVQLTDGQKFSFDLSEDLGDTQRVRLPHIEILNTLRKNDILLLDDGKLKFRVVDTTMKEKGEAGGSVTCEVVIGGTLSNKKGVNTPSIILPISPLTPKDRTDLDFILTLDVDWVALSFVQKPDDIAELKSIISASKTNNKLKVMAKLEKPSAIDYLEKIVDLSDGKC